MFTDVSIAVLGLEIFVFLRSGLASWTLYHQTSNQTYLLVALAQCLPLLTDQLGTLSNRNVLKIAAVLPVDRELNIGGHRPLHPALVLDWRIFV